MKKYLIFLTIFLLIQTAYAQERSIIEGLVLSDSSQLPLNGVTINSVRSKVTTTSDKFGRFHIAVVIPDTIKFSYVGYKDQIKVVDGDIKTLKIGLESDRYNLEDVMINTGYQKLKPNEVNGSFIVIDNKTLNKQSGLNVLDRLNGVTSSLLFNVGKTNGNPQSNTGITIRGLSTINGPLDPLIVVDNFIYTGDINNINPNDVESITILKDAAAASIWGARAGNGVIVITTKKGQFNQKLQIDISSDVIVSEKPDLYATPQISSSDYIDFEQLLFNNGYYNADFLNRSRPAISPAVQIFQDRHNGLLSAEDSVEQITKLKTIDNRRQYQKYFSHKGIIQQYAVNLRGGNQNVGWLISGTFDRDKDNSLGEYKKINLRFENSYRPFKNFSLNAGVYYTNSTNTTGYPSYDYVSKLNNSRYVPYKNLVGESGQSIPVLWNLNPRYTDTAGSGYLLNWNYYPLEDYKHSFGKKNIEQITAHIGLDYKIMKGLGLNLMYQYAKQRTNQRNLNDTSSYYTRDLINKFSQLDLAKGVVNYIVPLGGILDNSNTSVNSYNFRSQLNFDRVFWNHHIKAIAGFEVRDAWTSNDGATYYGYYSDPLTNSSNLDYSITYPTFISGAKLRIPHGNILNSSDNRFVSIFSNLSYGYKNRYTFNASARKDGSNIFGANTNDKWSPLWSLGLGWVLSKEEFYRFGLLPYLKLSATYGVSGNVDLTKTSLPIGKYSSVSIGSVRLPSLGILSINNPDLSWERSYQTNIRLDFASNKSIISGSLEFYKKRGTNLYAPTPYDYTTFGGTPTITANVANMKGKGVDVVINSININRSIKWTTSFLYNYNQSITTKYFTGQGNSLSSFLGGSNQITPVVGKPLYALAAYRWGGLDASGDPQGYLHDTLTTDYRAISKSSLNDGLAGGSIVYIGSATPTSYGSLMNDVSYKGFTLSFNIIYKFGYYIVKPSLSYSALAKNGVSGLDYENRWQQAGDEKKTNVPSFSYPLDVNRDYFYKASEINVIKGDHVRLQFINLSYSLQSQKENRIFKSLQVYLNIANLGVLWRENKEHIDPDYPDIAAPPKTYTMGIRASF